MKASKALKIYYRRRIKSILKLLEKPQEKFTQKDFHRIRIEIKRTKALFFLIEALAKNFNRKKYFEPLTFVFQQAGIVREFQIQDALLKRYKPDPFLDRYFNEQNELSVMAQQGFFVLLNKEFNKELKQQVKRIIPILDKIKQQSVVKFLKDKRNTIDSFFKEDYPEVDHLHELRKQIKELSNLQKIFRPKKDKLHISDDFQELLGEWHDCSVVIDDLDQKVHNHNLTPEEIKGLQTLKQKIYQHANRLLTRIHKQITMELGLQGPGNPA